MTNIDSFKTYRKAQSEVFEAFQEILEFELIVEKIDSLYLRGTKLIPATEVFYGNFFLASVRAFLSSMSLVLQGQPDDAALITRRAIEGIKIALSCKINEDFYERWNNLEKINSLWNEFNEGKFPRNNCGPNLPETNPLVMNVSGFLTSFKRIDWIYSQRFCHFNPEYILGLEFKPKPETKEYFLNFFISDTTEIVTHVVLTTSTHRNILKIFNEIFDGAFYKNCAWKEIVESLDSDLGSLMKKYQIGEL